MIQYRNRVTGEKVRPSLGGGWVYARPPGDEWSRDEFLYASDPCPTEWHMFPDGRVLRAGEEEREIAVATRTGSHCCVYIHGVGVDRDFGPAETTRCVYSGLYREMPSRWKHPKDR